MSPIAELTPANRLRVAVITPYYREPPEMLRLCHDSVRSQSHACTHFLVADGHPQEQVSGWEAQHLILPRSHQDVGNTPRCLGALSAVSQDYDAVTFLDADNWLYPNHVEALVRLQQQSGADVCTATRSMHRLDGSLMYVDRHESDGKNHVDTNCFFLSRSAFTVLPVWALMPRQLALVGDTVFLQAVLARHFRLAHLPQPTVAYRTSFRVHYEMNGEPAPPGTRSNEETTGRSLRWWNSLPEEARKRWSEALLGPGRLLVLPGGTDGGVPRSGPAGPRSLPEESAFNEENNLGVQLLAQSRFAKAETIFRRLLLQRPDLPEVVFNLAKALHCQERLAEAEECYRQVLRQRPNWAEAHFHLGLLCDTQRRLTDAEAAFRRTLELVPDHLRALDQLAGIRAKQGRSDEARALYRQVLALPPGPDRVVSHQNLLLNEQYDPAVTLAGLAELHAEWQRLHAAPLRSTWRPFSETRRPERPLRLGFVSGDFALHPVGFFLAPVLERLGRTQWLTFCYANQEVQDVLTARLKKAAGTWRPVSDLSDEALADRIRADGIDLLIDLSGHTGRNRLLTFARRPAPVQLSWIGYVGTTGLEAIDYLIADRFHVPPGWEQHYREQVLRLPDGYVCYEPPAYAPAVGPLPALTAGHVTFGSFNNIAKINPQVIAVWADVLRRVPHARLVLKYHWLDDAGLRSRLTEQFAAQGVAADRLELLGSTRHQDQLQQYNRIDLALDTFPYSGGLTTCEASWMGVPVITCPGETFASRHSLSHLSNIGLTETVAQGRAEYVEMAVRLAGDLSHLAEMRAGLRPRMAGSPLCDVERFTSHFAAALSRCSAAEPPAPPRQGSAEP